MRGLKLKVGHEALRLYLLSNIVLLILSPQERSKTEILRAELDLNFCYCDKNQSK